MKPLARKGNLFSVNLPEEVIVYNKSDNKVHCLNKIAAAIWESCDGTRTADELAEIVEARLGAPPDLQVVQLALEELERAELLEPGTAVVPDAALASRHEAVPKIAKAGSALVATIVAPAPEAHASMPPGPLAPMVLRLGSRV
jgi:hypothetical protein